MSTLSLKEATSLMHSYGIKCDKETVKGWLQQGKIKSRENEGHYLIEENEIFEFLESYRWEGTAYEKDTDDKTKIYRLLEEIYEFRKTVSDLEKENRELKEQLAAFGVMPF